MLFRSDEAVTPEPAEEAVDVVAVTEGTEIGSPGEAPVGASAGRSSAPTPAVESRNSVARQQLRDTPQSAVSASQDEPAEIGAVPASVDPGRGEEVPSPVGTLEVAPVSSAPEATSSALPGALTGPAPAAATSSASAADGKGGCCEDAAPVDNLNAVVQGFLHSSANWLATLPVNPATEFLSGALLLVRRSLFNQAPVASSTQTVTISDGVGQGRIIAADPEGDPLTYTITKAPRLGTVVIDAAGNYTYTANGPDMVVDTFTVAVADQGFNLLQPSSERASAVQVLLSASPLVGSGWDSVQRFQIVNTTNHILWLQESRWVEVHDFATFYNNGPKAYESCSENNFCLTDKASDLGRKDLRWTALAPGEVLDAAIETSYQREDAIGHWLNLDFRNSAGQSWLVQITPTVIQNDAAAKIEGRWTAHTGNTYVGEGQPWELDPNNSKRIFLTESGTATHNISSDATWITTPPASCGFCRQTWANSDKPFTLIPIDVFRNMLALDGSGPFYGREYSNVSYVPITDKQVGTDDKNQPLNLDNLSGQALNKATYKWTVTSDPGPQPSSPWWHEYASQGVTKLADSLLGGFVGDAIASFVNTQLGLDPPKIKEPVTASGFADLTAAPYSKAILLTSGPKYNVNGDVVLRFGKTAFSFKDMPFQIVEANTTKYTATFIQQPIQTTDNEGFQLTGEGASLPTYKVGSENPLEIRAFVGTGLLAAPGEDFSARGCSAKVTTNCTTFEVDRSKAEIKMFSGRAMLVPKATDLTAVGQKDNVEVTATYSWELPAAGVDTAGRPLPPEVRSVRATMTAFIVDSGHPGSAVAPTSSPPVFATQGNVATIRYVDNDIQTDYIPWQGSNVSNQGNVATIRYVDNDIQTDYIPWQGSNVSNQENDATIRYVDRDIQNDYLP